VEQIGEINCEKFENGIQFVDDEKFVSLDPERIYEYKLSEGEDQYYLYVNDLKSSFFCTTMRLIKYQRMKFYLKKDFQTTSLVIWKGNRDSFVFKN